MVFARVDVHGVDVQECPLESLMESNNKAENVLARSQYTEECMR